LQGGVMSESNIADLFSLQQLGPFPLVHRPDVTLVKEKTTKTWSAAMDEILTGNIASTLPLSGDGLDFWLGACEVDWAYQAAEGGSGSFEEYGGFFFNDAVYEIGSSDSVPEMTLHFSWPFEMTEEDWNKCSNPAPVTIAPMLAAGAQEYCWEVDHDYCSRGCFIYKTDKGYQGFAVKSFALDSIGPFYLDEVNLPVTITGDTWTGEEHSGSVSTGTKELGTIGRNFWFDASEVTWAYQGASADTSSQSFYKYGGYVLRDAEGSPTMMLEIGANSDSDNSILTVEFGNPFEISSVEWSACQNPAPVTIDSMKELGAQEYCWEQHWDRCPRGCFFYKTTDGYQAFAVEDFAMSSLGPFHLADAGVTEVDTVSGAASNTWLSGALSGKMTETASSGAFWTNAGYQGVQWLYQTTDAQGSTESFELYGGFLVTKGSVTTVLEIMSEAAEGTLTQGFNDPMHITWAQFDSGCGAGHAAITLEPLLTIGTEQYCWVPPGTTTHCESGCFYYKTRTGYQAFAVHSA